MPIPATINKQTSCKNFRGVSIEVGGANHARSDAPTQHRYCWFPFLITEVLSYCSALGDLVSFPTLTLSSPASPAIEHPVEALDGQRPVIRPIPHVAILRDEFTQLFNDDYDEEEEEMEARGEHTLSEKFGGHFAALVNDVLSLEVSRINRACWVYLCLVSNKSCRVPFLCTQDLCYSTDAFSFAAARVRRVSLPKLSEMPRQPWGRVFTGSASPCSLPGAHLRPRLQPDLRGLPERGHVQRGGHRLRLSGGLDRRPLQPE